MIIKTFKDVDTKILFCSFGWFFPWMDGTFLRGVFFLLIAITQEMRNLSQAFAILRSKCGTLRFMFLFDFFLLLRSVSQSSSIQVKFNLKMKSHSTFIHVPVSNQSSQSTPSPVLQSVESSLHVKMSSPAPASTIPAKQEPEDHLGASTFYAPVSPFSCSVHLCNVT